VLKPISA